jgi:Homing endonuclease associated repeat
VAHNVTKNTTPEEVIAIVRKCAEELGHVPSLDELLRITKISKYLVRRHFGPYVKALEACGLERHGCGYRVEMRNLFLDWGGIVRKLGKVPSMLEYELHGKYTIKPLVRHFGGWTHVAAGMMGYAREAQLEDQWKDVLEVAASSLKVAPPPARTSVQRKNQLTRPRKLRDEPVYGPPMAPMPMAFCPTNEAGVAVLFGAMAKDLGMAITRVQTEFPDCEAMREVEPDRWQRVRVEFEYESRNFLTHQHPVDGCDLIVCWRHNWPECPLEVVELKEAVREIGTPGHRESG